MNKLIILATFLAVAVRVSCAMPHMQDEEDIIQALFQHVNAETQQWLTEVTTLVNGMKEMCYGTPTMMRVDVCKTMGVELAAKNAICNALDILKDLQIH